MTDVPPWVRSRKALSKKLSYYLRHAPGELGLELEMGGWVALAELIKGLEARGIFCTEDEIAEVVVTSDKGRFSLEGGRIRANQGHSVPVELELVAQEPPPTLYHGSTRRNLESILASGLHRGSRHHVHLSQDLGTALQVGRRHGPVILLAIDARSMHQDGLSFYLSSNRVWLTDHVPARYLRVCQDFTEPKERKTPTVPVEVFRATDQSELGPRLEL